MLRRSLLIGMSLMPICPTVAQDSLGSSNAEDAIAPLELGAADFADAWEFIGGDETVLVAANQDLPSGYAEAFGSIVFSKLSDIDAFFQNQTQNDFINFFNTQVAGKAHWAGKKISGSGVRPNFEAYWTSVLAKGPITATHFLCYMSVFINEIEGNLKSRVEGYGSRGHPGIAYLFDTVAMKSANGRTWRKKSYNQNKSMFQLLNDALFLEGRQGLRFASELANTKDPVWGGDAYPADRFPTAGDLVTTGIILEGDFFKFRGRGLIQTTWRDNYKKLATHVLQNTNASAAVSEFTARHQGRSADQICTASTNQEWNELFADPDKVVLTAAVQIHAKGGKYLPLATEGSVLNADASVSGSIRAMGDRIGGRGYGGNLKARVRQICMAIGRP